MNDSRRGSLKFATQISPLLNFILTGKDANGQTLKITWVLVAADDKKKGEDWDYFDFPTVARSQAACYFDKHIERLWVFGGIK